MLQNKEISKISEYLDQSEKILIMSRQDRWYPGGSPVTPNTIFVTDRKIIIRNPMLLGLREHVDYYNYEDIVNIKHVQGYFTSSLVITTAGMGTAARRDDNEDGIIKGIPKEDAIKIQKIVREMSNGKKNQ